MERLKGYTTLPFHSTLRVLHLQVESASYEKMLGNMQWPVPEEDRHVLKASLENMQAAIQMILEQMDPAFANDSTQSPSETLQQQADESW